MNWFNDKKVSLPLKILEVFLVFKKFNLSTKFLWKVFPMDQQFKDLLNLWLIWKERKFWMNNITKIRKNNKEYDLKSNSKKSKNKSLIKVKFGKVDPYLNNLNSLPANLQSKILMNLKKLRKSKKIERIISSKSVQLMIWLYWIKYVLKETFY